MPGQGNRGGGSGGGQRSLTYERGKIVACNEQGLKLEGDEDWRNWTQYVGVEKRPSLSVGMTVKVGQDNDGWVRDVKGGNGETLGAGPTAGAPAGGGKPFTIEDSWRMTLLSCLSSAATWYPTLHPEDQDIIRDVSDDKPKLTHANATFRVAQAWAERVWKTPLPAAPQPVAPPAQPAAEQ